MALLIYIYQNNWHCRAVRSPSYEETEENDSPERQLKRGLSKRLFTIAGEVQSQFQLASSKKEGMLNAVCK